MALPWGVYVAADLSNARRADVIRHELVHIDQWRRLGWRRFVSRYCGEYVAGRRQGLTHEAAYRAISLENEAAEQR